MPYPFLADAVLGLHFLFVVFVVGGLPLIIVGNLRGWRWVSRRDFRYTHVAAIGLVVVQSWLNVDCPLTTLEMWLRVRAASPAYAGSCIEHWLHALLFYQAPSWAFVLAYTLFGALVAAAWWRFPPE